MGLDHRTKYPNMAEPKKFDCFLSHNSQDKPAVRTLAKELRAHGISVWLDEERLRPGIPWQPLLESGIDASHSVAVLVGADGLGPWEQMEMRAALSLAVEREIPVIPVLLPDAPTKPRLPLFLRNFTWVDLRQRVDAGSITPIGLLIWGITGQHPHDSGRPDGRKTGTTRVSPAQVGRASSQEAKPVPNDGQDTRFERRDTHKQSKEAKPVQNDDQDPMMRYRVLVADDEPALNHDRYGLLLDDPDDGFYWEMAGTRAAFKHTDFSQYDAVVLDINLTQWGYMPLSEAVRTIPSSVPIVFASGRWHEEATIRVIREVLADAKDANFVQILILDDLTKDTAPLKIRAMREQLRLAIAKAQRYTQLSVGDEEPIHILHLSDPQYGDPDTDGWAGFTEEQTARFLYDLCPRLHLVAITGDITYQGLPSQFDVARSRIGTLLTKFFGKGGQERLLLVPGNHDVNLRLAAADCVDFDFESGRPVFREGSCTPTGQRRFALEPFARFAWELTGDPRWLSAGDLCWVNESFRHLGLRFIVLNTVSELDCSSPARATLPLETLRSLVPSPREPDRLFSIALAHHGPASTPAGPDDITVANWQDVGSFLQVAGVRMFVHGHGHERRVERLGWDGAPAMVGGRPADGQLGQDEFLRVMAPTSHVGSQRRPDGAPRGFNLITLERHERQVQRVKVQTFALDRGRPVGNARAEFTI